MSAAVTAGYVFDTGLLSLSNLFTIKTGGKLPNEGKPKAYYLSCDYYTKAWSIAERLNVPHILFG